MEISKKYFSLIIIGLMVLSCDQSSTSDSNNHQHPPTTSVKETEMNRSQDSNSPDKLFIHSDAEKILGEPAHLSDSSTSISTDALKYHCSYTANSKEKGTGKTGAVYFLFEDYYQEVSAKNKYSFIMKANEDNGISVLDNIGDEAYFHTDKSNFYLIMVRKGKKVFNMKVNKLTSTTSFDKFSMVAKQITDAL